MQRHKWLAVCCGLVLAASLCLASNQAHAQRKRGTSIKLDDIKVVGKIQKPQAFYVLSRAPLNYKNFQLRRSFVQKVIESVKKSPF